jgi:DNA-binding NtrC family response regulator
VALHRILVVDDSLAVRETIGILLGGDYEVHASTVDQYAATGILGEPPELIIAARAAAPRCAPRPFPPGVPVLWIEGADDPPGVPAYGASLPRPFSPRELRRRVVELLAAPQTYGAGSSHAARLRPPYVSAEVGRAIAPALATTLPLHLVGEPGTGKRSLARAVHVARGGGPFLPLPALHFDASALAAPSRPGAALFLDRVEQLSPHAQQDLLAALEPSGLVRTVDGAGLRLITSATTDLGAAADAGTFTPDLYYRLTVLTVRLAPLRERPEDIRALAQALAAELGALLGRSPVSLTERALERLANYLWFGNLAELEAVLARTVALAREPLIDADDLLFDGTRLPVGPAAASPHESPAVLGGRPLDLIINELAHEFKNPLVTIKTFAHHLRRSLPRGGEEEQVARLTGEAVAQIDQTLENLLEFTRLDAPVPQLVRLSTVVDPVLDECGQALAARGVALDHPPLPPVTVRGDPQQLAYALANLVHALTRDLPQSARLGLRFGEPAVLTFELPQGSDPLGSHLATLLDHSSAAAPGYPLGVAIANAVLERNGAQVTVPEDAPSTVTVRFAVADKDTPIDGTGNGTSPRPGR